MRNWSWHHDTTCNLGSFCVWLGTKSHFVADVIWQTCKTDVDLKGFYCTYIINSPGKPWRNRNLSLPHNWENAWHLKWEQFLLWKLIDMGKTETMFYALVCPSKQDLALNKALAQIHSVMSSYFVSHIMCKQCTSMGNIIMCPDLCIIGAIQIVLLLHNLHGFQWGCHKFLWN